MPILADYYHDECPCCGAHTGVAATTYSFNFMLCECPHCHAELMSDYFDENGDRGFRWFQLAGGKQ